MTKFIYAMSLFLLAAISIEAQPIQKTSSCLLHGSVVSSTDATAIAGATVRLYQLKKLVGGTVSDASGNFNVKCPSSGSLQLRITAVGFKEVDTTLNVPTVTPLYIYMRAGKHTMDEVTVTASEKRGMTSTTVIGQTAMEHLLICWHCCPEA